MRRLCRSNDDVLAGMCEVGRRCGPTAPAALVEGADGDRPPAVRGLPAVLHRVVECWSAHFTPDAVAASGGVEPPEPEVLVRLAAVAADS